MISPLVPSVSLSASFNNSDSKLGDALHTLSTLAGPPASPLPVAQLSSSTSSVFNGVVSLFVASGDFMVRVNHSPAPAQTSSQPQPGLLHSGSTGSAGLQQSAPRSFSLHIAPLTRMTDVLEMACDHEGLDPTGYTLVRADDGPPVDLSRYESHVGTSFRRA
eukprot:Opistho-2@742